ncbi:mannose-1-phosphate guanylyltransferase/mannose-6-phosphate isomerase [Acuticoccus kandeliae]|uniref:mannose-1-phosphate guanylyltransferase/mannose-6-phosphate isomerase n=1 Tax=Acuticoccus kandeliae TaxID=2073160 RepID=UPI000D3E7D56|nr:mannose-1-phosphate guanylyltransferase/mannose-6-phosphate isomerase [Acuticoccus kandeliae]
MSIYPVVLAGGRGTRLWPLSRADKPKQFLPMHGEHSLFQKTIERHAGIDGLAAPWVVCGVADRFQVDDGLTGIGVSDATVMLEPSARNTAPAIAAVAEALVALDPDAILFVLPSDHLITPDAAYFETLQGAFAAARAGKMVTFGVTPTHPETGYGYIKAAPGGDTVRPVERFVEKPPIDEAARMVADGSYFWNAGFFAFGARAFLDELAKTAPEVVEVAAEAVAGAKRENGSILLSEAAYARAPDISIDYALFERTQKAAVAPISCRWSDVGSWRAYWETLDKDDAGNAIRGKGISVGSKNSLIVSNRADVVALGVEDMAIIAVEDAILVCPLDRAQDVKNVVATLKSGKRHELLDVSPTVNRPWGGYSSIMNGPRFQVKHLFVSPGKRLSLQKHHHRQEHWVVVRGTAEVTIDGEVQTLTENQSTYIPLGAVHRLANPGRILLEVIEVQTGSYLGEDDIVRLQDEWGRT